MTPPLETDISELILSEIREVRQTQAEILQRVATVEARLAPLVDNGKEGMITKLSNRIGSLERWRWILVGGWGVLTALLAAAITVSLHYSSQIFS